MLSSDILAPHFIGATSTKPISSRSTTIAGSTVVKAYVVPRAYYAGELAEDFYGLGPDKTLAYVKQANTQAIVFIEA